MSNLMQVSTQWATRPADQRFVSLPEMLAFKQAVRDRSKSVVVSSRKIEALPMPDHKGMVVVGPNGHAYHPNNWAFGQLCQRAEAPAGFLRTLPAEIAADALNYKLRFERSIEEVGVLLERFERPTNIANGLVSAVTGPNYGRVWDSEIIETLIRYFGDGVTGAWKVPGEFGKDIPITKDNTTLYASDRDMFVFLADEKNRIDINRRGGKGLARGFWVKNSEVGNSTLTVATFYFDFACCNRIIWGAEGFQEITIRHTASAPDKWLEQVQPALLAYQNKDTGGITQAIKIAQETKVREDLDDFLGKRFGRRLVDPLKTIHTVEEDRPIESYWDVATAVTAYARTIEHIDRRVELETAAGKVLDLVAVRA